MDYAELRAARDRLRSVEICDRARRKAVAYRSVQRLLRQCNEYPKSHIIYEANQIRSFCSGINLPRFRRIIQTIVQEDLCW